MMSAETTLQDPAIAANVVVGGRSMAGALLEQRAVDGAVASCRAQIHTRCGDQLGHDQILLFKNGSLVVTSLAHDQSGQPRGY